MRVLCLLVSLSCLSCASYWNNSARSATTGAAQALADPAVKQQLADVASGTIEAAGDKANAAVQKIATTASGAVFTQQNHDYIVGLAADVRDEMTGPRLKDNVSSAVIGAITDATPALQSAIQGAVSGATLSVKSDVDQELPKLERVLYIVLAAIGGAIVPVLLIMGLLVHETRKHRKAIEGMVSSRETR